MYMAKVCLVYKFTYELIFEKSALYVKIVGNNYYDRGISAHIYTYMCTHTHAVFPLKLGNRGKYRV